MTVSKRLVARVAALALSSLCAAAGVAQANTIGPDCTNHTCQGSYYTLTNLGFIGDTNSDGVADAWRIELDIDTSGYIGDGTTKGTRIDEVAVKVSDTVDATSIYQAPGGASNWTVVAGGINSNGCSGSGSGFECADWASVGIGAPVGGTLTWIFDIDVNGALFTAANAASIKARYTDDAGNKVGALVSEDITLGDSLTPVPEPGSMMLFGGGIFGLVARLRARRRSA